MADSSKVAKQLINRGGSGEERKVVGFQIAATAPDAFEAQGKILQIARSESGKPPLPPKAEVPAKALPSEGSPLALREDHRIIRSKPGYTLKQPREPWRESDESKSGMRDFHQWNPAPLVHGPAGSTPEKEAEESKVAHGNTYAGKGVPLCSVLKAKAQATSSQHRHHRHVRRGDVLWQRTHAARAHPHRQDVGTNHQNGVCDRGSSSPSTCRRFWGQRCAACKQTTAGSRLRPR